MEDRIYNAIEVWSVIWHLMQKDERMKLFNMIGRDDRAPFRKVVGLVAKVGSLAGKKLTRKAKRAKSEARRAMAHAKSCEEEAKTVAEQHSRYISSRNRKSAPTTITRNVELCDKRKKNRKYWTLERLRKHYGFSVRAVTKILSQEEKWRKMAALLPRDGTK